MISKEEADQGMIYVVSLLENDYGWEHECAEQAVTLAILKHLAYPDPKTMKGMTLADFARKIDSEKNE